MPRTRKRNWPQLVYKFDAYPHAIPDELWEQARAMQTLWNELVMLRDQAREEVKGLDKAAAKPRWEQFNREIAAAAARAPLGWEARGDVLDRFQVASRKAFKEGAVLTPQRGLRQIMLPHRFTGGGMPIAQFLAQTRAERVRITPVDPAAYTLTAQPRRRATATHGIFGVVVVRYALQSADGTVRLASGFPTPAAAEAELAARAEEFAEFSPVVARDDVTVPLSFLVHLDRPFPAGAIVKRVMWCGTYLRSRRARYLPAHQRYRSHPWRWSIQFVLEVPPETVAPPARTDTLVAGLDLGWRVMGEGEYLRIGYIVDSAGRRIELRLPMLGTEQRNRGMHRALRYEPMAHTIYDVWGLDAQVGEGVEACKAALRSLLDPLPAGFEQMRQGGLRRLLHEFRRTGTHPEAQAVLAAWDQRCTRLMGLRTQVAERLLARKRWLYRNLAKWLTTTYRTIVWEGDLSTKQLAQQEDGPVLQNAAKFRAWAAIGELRSDIAYAARKNGCEIIGPDGAYSTIECWECGALVEKGPSLYLECPNGHRWDQDENAARNLLAFSQTSPADAHEGGLRSFRPNDTVQPLDIPSVLRAVVVPHSQE